MRRLVEKLGFSIFIVAALPIAGLMEQVLKSFNMGEEMVCLVLSPFLLIQITAFILLMIYREEILGY